MWCNLLILISKNDQENRPQDNEGDEEKDDDNERSFVRTLWWRRWWYRCLHVIVVVRIDVVSGIAIEGWPVLSGIISLI